MLFYDWLDATYAGMWHIRWISRYNIFYIDFLTNDIFKSVLIFLLFCHHLLSFLKMYILSWWNSGRSNYDMNIRNFHSRVLTADPSTIYKNISGPTPNYIKIPAPKKFFVYKFLFREMFKAQNLNRLVY